MKTESTAFQVAFLKHCVQNFLAFEIRQNIVLKMKTKVEY
jgi:hypothetical protein